MDAIPGKGWFNPLEDFVEETPGGETLAQMAEENEALNESIRKTFNTRDGKRVLAWLENLLEQPAFNPALGFYDGSAYGYWREGQNDVVHQIRSRKRKAEEG